MWRPTRASRERRSAGWSVCVAALAVVSLIVGPSARSGPVAPPGLTPSQTSALLHGYHFIGEDLNYKAILGATFVKPVSAGAWILSASCTGIGKPSAGRYLAFSCQITFSTVYKSDQVSGVGRLWVRLNTAKALVGIQPPKAYYLCASDMGISDCAPWPPLHPLPNDPRLHHDEYSRDSLGLGRAVADAWIDALVRQYGMPLQAARDEVGNGDCIPANRTSWLSYRCAFVQQPSQIPAVGALVTFAPHPSGWTTSVQFLLK
jgi:hypothetical protein